MTYNVFVGTLNLTLTVNQSIILVLTTTDAALAAVNNRLKPTAHNQAIPRLFSYNTIVNIYTLCF